MNFIRAHKKFHALSEQEVRRVLHRGDNDAVIQELSRLVGAYKTFFEEECEKSARTTENFLRILVKWPIEAVAVALAATGHDKEMEKIEEEKITPGVLALTGQAAFGRQWQTLLAEELGINDRTMRRWAVDGAPVRIVDELREIASDRVECMQRALALLRYI